VFEGTALIWSDIVSGVTTTGYQEILSPTLSLALTVGNTYAIGAIGNFGNITYAFGNSAPSQNGVNPLTNENVFSFDTPALTVGLSAYLAVSLYGSIAEVPLPASAPALLAALAALAMWRRRA
jgi:hypothetical protein